MVIVAYKEGGGKVTQCHSILDNIDKNNPNR